MKTVVITGAAGNLGGKLRSHIEKRHALRLIDADPRGDSRILRADLSRWDESWARHFVGADTVVHLAADPTAQQPWAHVIAPNLDALVHVFEAGVRGGVRRIVYASSNHVMGGYQEIAEPFRLTTDIPPAPGTRYIADGESRDSTPYGSAKLFGERLGKCLADIYGLCVIAVRIGWIRPGENRPEELPLERGEWFRLMWLSNRDYCHLMERCIEADLSPGYYVVNGMSSNTGMRWDVEYTRKLIGYEPLDDVTR